MIKKSGFKPRKTMIDGELPFPPKDICYFGGGENHPANCRECFNGKEKGKNPCFVLWLNDRARLLEHDKILTTVHNWSNSHVINLPLKLQAPSLNYAALNYDEVNERFNGKRGVQKVGPGERELIERLLENLKDETLSLRDISKIVNRSPATISGILNKE